MAKTVSDFINAAPVETLYESGSLFMAALGNMATFGRQLPPWWSPARDAEMRRLWREDSMLLSAFMFAAQTKLSNMPIRVVARDPNIDSHVALAHELNEQFHSLSEFGQGMSTAISRFAEDYFGTDNGGFIEIVAPGDKSQPISGIPLGIRALDSAYCVRRSDPEFPVKYIKPNGEPVLYHMSRVISLSQMPASARAMNGVGFCAVSRSIEVAKRYADMTLYIRGKMGGATAKKLLVGRNISGREMIKAMAASAALASQIGDIDTDTIAIGGPDIEVDSIDLYHYPELNEEAAVISIISSMALAWGLEFSEAYPLVASKAADEVSLQRSRGKMPAAFVNQFQRLMSYRLVPPFLKVDVDFDDDSLDQQREIIADIRARNLERMTNSGVMTAQAARRRLLTDGYISESDYLDLCLAEGMLPDGTPVTRAFVDPQYEGILTVPENYLSGDADFETVRAAVERNRVEIWRLYPNTTSQFLHRRYKVALAALDALMDIYEAAQMREIAQMAAEQEDSQDDQEEDSQETPTNTAAREQPGQSIDNLEKTVKALDDLPWYSRVKSQVEAFVGQPIDEQNLLTRMDDWMRVAFLLGSGLDAVPDEDKDVLENELTLVAGAAAVIVARQEKGSDMAPTAARLLGQIRRVYNYAWIEYSAEEEESYSWNLGATEEHCGDCAERAGLGPRPGSFWREEAKRGYYPGSGALECSGLHCDCSYG